LYVIPRDEVAVLFGGDGSEHRVSVASAQNVARTLTRASLWLWRREGFVSVVSRDELVSFERPFETDFEPSGSDPRGNDLASALDGGDAMGKVFFLALHGGSGENGTVQSMLETRGLAFTGSGAEASRLAFDKARTRETVRARGIRVADACIASADSATHERLAHLFELHEKIVVKPVADGSSHGLRVVTSERELNASIAHLIANPDTPHLAEAFVEGREITVGVLETERGLEALPCSEVVLEAGRTFDFDGKYLGKGVREVTPAEVSEEMARSAQAVALTAHEAVGCRGYSRTDVIVGEEGPVFLEINTLPGLTRASFIPQQLAAAGIDLAVFLERQLVIGRSRRSAAK
jgi:D-alanine-D-alanine ligase